jgi:hypothetical protein
MNIIKDLMINQFNYFVDLSFINNYIIINSYLYKYKLYEEDLKFI